MKLKFLGGAGTVTGSKYLIETGSTRILIDCGMFQGLKELRLKNWLPFVVAPSSIDAILLTHAHIDHSGYIPRLVQQGFNGPIYCSHGTFDLCKILLPDAGYLQEEEARYANKEGFSKHTPALPLYTELDAELCLKKFRAIDWHKETSIGDLKFKLYPAGHILGASMIRVLNHSSSILFSGDLGRSSDLTMKPPEVMPPADYLVVESTYGNRTHSQEDVFALVEEIILDAYKKKSVIVVPAFAVGRAQTLLHIVSELKQQNRIPDFPIYLNSPMANSATDLFCRYQKEHRLSLEQCQQLNQIATSIHSSEESKTLNFKKGPMMIISASGMATGGRVVHHLKAFIGDERNLILFTGYQALGTRGADLLTGAKEIKIHGEFHPVKAQIKILNMLSSHADGTEILKWCQKGPSEPKSVFITHGEKDGALALKNLLSEKLKWNCHIPEMNQEFLLSNND